MNNDLLHFHHLIICSGTAGMITSLCVTPLDVIKVHMQVYLVFYIIRWQIQRNI